MKNFFFLPFFICLSGCSTLGAAFGISPSEATSTASNDLVYYPVIDLRNRTYPNGIPKQYSNELPNNLSDNHSKILLNENDPRVNSFDTQFINFNSWLRDIVRLEKSAFTKCNNVESETRTYLHACFDKLDDPIKQNHRNRLVTTAMAYSDNNCIHRGNKTGNVINTTDSLVNVLSSAAATVGLAASDATSARAAAGVYGAANAIWNESKSNLLKDTDFASLTIRLAELRVTESKTILDKTKVGEDYKEWPLMTAVNDVNEYDNKCDFFK